MKTFKTLLKTEGKLSLRGLDMFIFAICMPVVVVVILGAVFGDKPAFDGAEYTFLEQSFGAVSAIAICAGGVMGLPLVVSDYRSRKILKRFKVTPADPALILAVQVAIYALYSIASLILIYITGALFFWISAKRFMASVSRGILACHVVHVQHWAAGGGNCTEHENSRCRRQPAVLSNADFFRCHSALRGDACCISKSSRPPSADSGN